MGLPTDLVVSSGHVSVKALSRWMVAIGTLIRIDVPRLKKIWYLEDVLITHHPAHYKLLLSNPKTHKEKTVEFITLDNAVRNGFDEPRIVKENP